MGKRFVWQAPDGEYASHLTGVLCQQIKNDIGRCENLRTVYDSATTFMCRNALDGLVNS